MRVSEAARITLLNDIPVFHVHHTAGGFTRHFHFVGNDNLRNVGFRQLANNADDLGGDFRVQRGGGFIKQQYRRFHHQRTGNGHALLLTTGQVQRVAVAVGLEAQTLQQLFGTRDGLIFA